MIRSWMLVGATVLLIAAGGAVAAEAVPSRPSVDAPELARLGPHAVGVASLILIQKGQPDVLAPVGPDGKLPLRDRVLPIDIWYPAQIAKGAKRAAYFGTLPGEPPRPPVPFSIPGLAVRGAVATAGSFPLVVVSHGYSGTPSGMTWLTENLASKGYVVVAIHHRDPDYSNRAQSVEPLFRRPLDIAFVARSLLNLKDPALAGADRGRMALIGYSMGGYGVLTDAGASLDPHSPLASTIPGGAMVPYLRGGALAGTLLVPGLKAVVAISPAGAGNGAWTGGGLSGITAPVLLIGGDRDHTVGFAASIQPVFDQATASDRYLLVFQNAGHAIGMSSVPPTMRDRLWDQDWFEDPIWRHELINGVEQHMITAFLDRFVKGDTSRSAYLDTDVAISDNAVWPKDGPPGYDPFSPGGAGATWKGFRKGHNGGLELHHKPPGS